MAMQQASIHERSVLQLIANGQATSQLRLAELLGRPRNSIKEVVDRLLRAGYICVDRKERYGRGRPIIHYRVRQFGTTMAIRWTGTVFHSTLFRDDEQLVGVRERNTANIDSLAEALETLRQVRDDTLAAAKLPGPELDRILLSLNAVPGKDGELSSSSVLPWLVPTNRDVFTDALGCEVSLLLGSEQLMTEFRARAAEGTQRMALFHAGDGISGHGVLVGDWGARHEYRGEVGHVVVVPDGPQCGCGNRGCLEAVASGPALVRRVQADHANGVDTQIPDINSLTPRALFDHLYNDDLGAYGAKLAKEFLDRAAWGISLIVNVIGPEVVVLTGYGLEDRDRWLEELRRRIPRYAIFNECDIAIEFARTDADAQLRSLVQSHII